jgi:hypothetical protein
VLDQTYTTTVARGAAYLRVRVSRVRESLVLIVLSFSLPLDDIKADPTLASLADNADVCRFVVWLMSGDNALTLVSAVAYLHGQPRRLARTSEASRFTL